MDKDEKAHKILGKFIGAMKKCSMSMGFRIQVLVDEIDEMKGNKWKLRIKKEKAKKLDDLHKDFEKLQLKQHLIQSNASSPRSRPQYQKKKQQNNNNYQEKIVLNSNGNKNKNRNSPRRKNNSKFGKSSNSFGSSKFGKSNNSFGSNVTY